MEKLIKAELRNLNVLYISCVSGQAFDTFQVVYLHYKRIEEIKGDDFIYADYFYYNNYEEFKNDRDILENILNSQRVLK